jgi:hypothetical protein
MQSRYLGLGAAWYIVGLTWWVRRLRRLRAAEALSRRDLIQIEYPEWSRSLATGYLAVLAGMTGLLFFAAVIFVLVTVATK